MKRLKQLSGRALLSLTLTFGAVSAPVLPLTAVATLTVTQTACGPDSLEKLNTTLNQIAHSLEAAVDTNGRLYEAGAYGAKGSPDAIQTRQRVATVIHNSNEYLIQALEIAKGLTKATFEGSKLLILEKLSLAATGLRIGNPTIDLVLQSVATLISQAVAIAQLFNSSDVNWIRRAIPEINANIKALENIREINPRLEVFAE